MKPSFRFYRVCYCIVRVLFGIVYWFKVYGKENIPKGAAMVCANHSNVIDPIVIAFAFGLDHFLHFIAKVELFKIPILSVVVTKLGAISVDRRIQDVTTVKTTLNYLKKGEKVAIFPEGRRVTEDESAEAKSGAIKLAERAEVPIVPIYIPRKKRLFRKVPLVIGEPYIVEKQQAKRSADEYAMLADELMKRIERLNPKTRTG